MLVLQRTGVQFPAPYMAAHCNFGSRGSSALFWLPWAGTACKRCTDIQAKHTLNKNVKEVLRASEMAQ